MLNQNNFKFIDLFKLIQNRINLRLVIKYKYESIKIRTIGRGLLINVKPKKYQLSLNFFV